jgi:hypothetical protein
MNSTQRVHRENATERLIEPLIDEFEYAQITGRSVGSARRDRALGRGCPYVKLGQSVRYRPSDVRAYIAKSLKGAL